MLTVALGIVAVGAAAWLLDGYWPQRFADKLPKADRVVVKKSARQLVLMRDGDVIRQYEVSLGGSPTGHKTREGDSKTPEGHYTIDWRNPNSRFYRSLHISYPNAADRANAAAMGVSPGGDIMIHGLPNGMGTLARGFRGRDWTDGCIAVDNVAMAQIWHSVDNGTPIEILP